MQDTMVEKQRILVCGDVRGKYEQFIDRVININSKSGPFELVFCIGDFFGSSEREWTLFKSDKKSSPVPIYIMGPNNSNHISYYSSNDGQELAPNIFYIGKRGLFSTNSGLKIAYLSGLENKALPEICRITADDIDRVKNACIKKKHCYSGIDLLVTSCWPRGCMKYTKNRGQPMSVPKESALISQLVVEIKPRYHFCALENIYYERAPYRNISDHINYATRMVALADFGNTKKEKSMYALNMYPVQHIPRSDLIQMTTDTTECPYPIHDPKDRTSQYFYDLSAKTSSHPGKRRGPDHQGRDKFKFLKGSRDLTIAQNDCWFCMASKKFEDHLIIHIDEFAYLTLAKGPLTEDHAMIVPISHNCSLYELSRETKLEIDELKSTLSNYYKKQNKSVVFFERNFKSPHLQIHAVPIPTERVKIAKKVFTQISAEKQCPLTELPDNMSLLNVIQKDSEYFYMEIGDSKLLYLIKHAGFPLQLGRELLAHPHVLNVPEKVDWKKHELSKDEELKLVEDFQNKVFNPSIKN